MAGSSMQVCMDASDWLKGIVSEEVGMDAGGELIACSRPPATERRLRPAHDQALKCPRCESTHTKFCYYNNYSLSQPRYFCKTCRRYWTKGGSLRNVPVGGGCRKNKRSTTSGGGKKPTDQLLRHPQPLAFNVDGCAATDLHLSFPGLQLPRFESIPETHRSLNLMDFKYNSGLESEFGTMLGSSSGSNVIVSACEGNANYGFSFINGVNSNMLGFSVECGHGMASSEEPSMVDAKPITGWQDGGGCTNVGRSDAFGYSNGIGLWTGMLGSQGSSAAM